MSDEKLILPRRQVRGYGQFQNSVKREFRGSRNGFAKLNAQVQTLWNAAQTFARGQSSGRLIRRQGIVFSAHVFDGFYRDRSSSPRRWTAAERENVSQMHMLPWSGMRLWSNVQTNNYLRLGGYREDEDVPANAPAQNIGLTPTVINDNLNSGNIDFLYLTVFYGSLAVDTEGAVTWQSDSEDYRPHVSSHITWINPAVIDNYPLPGADSPEAWTVGDRMHFTIPTSLNSSGQNVVAPSQTPVMVDISIPFGGRIGIGTPSQYQDEFRCIGASRGTAYFDVVWQITLNWVGFGPAPSMHQSRVL